MANALFMKNAILLGHPGNTVKNIEGCILVGARHGKYEGLDAVFETSSTTNVLREILGTTVVHKISIRSVADVMENG